MSEIADSTELSITSLVLDRAYNPFVAMDRDGKISYWNAQAEVVFGWTKEEAIGSQLADMIIPARFREAHLEGMRRFAKTGAGKIINKTIEISAVNRDGEEFPVELAVFIIDPNSKFAFGAFIQVISQRKTAERWQAAQLAITRALFKAKDIGEVADEVISAFCTTAGWDVGALYLRDGDDRLEFMHGWSVESAQLSDFLEATRKIEFKLGMGLPGRVWAMGEPVMIYDLSQEDFPRSLQASATDLSSYFAFPLIGDEETVGVIEFFSRKPIQVESNLVQLFKTTGNQIAQFVSRRKVENELALAERHMRSVLDNMSEGVALIDQNLQTVIMNPSGQRVFGKCFNDRNQSETCGLFDVDMVTPLPREEMPQVRALRGEQVNGQECFARSQNIPEGTFISCNALPVYDEDGTVIAAIVVSRDITQRKQIENELRRTRDEALSATKLKSEFVANISHEIRTPLSGLMGMAELLTFQALDQESSEISTYILSAAKSLLQVVNDLLDFSKIEAGHLELNPTQFEMRQLIKDVIQSSEAVSAKKGLTLRHELSEQASAMFFADDLRIKQVLLNLMSNAIKFTETGTVTLKGNVASKSQDGTTIRFEVSDTGIGIEPEMQGKLFEPFVQADGSMTRKFGGTGLGLSICKRLVELMGGEIGLESIRGTGSTFWFTIPLGVGFNSTD